MRINRGDIFYFARRGEYQGNEVAKDRPGVIVSAEHLNTGERFVEVVWLTTQEKKQMNEHVQIASSGRISTALCEQVNSISVERIGNYYGHLSEEEMAAVDEALISSLGLNAMRGTEMGCEDTDKLKTERDTYKAMYESLLDRLVKP